MSNLERKGIAYRVWNSPTIMTWMSYSTKALTLVGVLPMVLKRFSAGDVVLWYLFSTIIALQAIADFGFRQTFTRIIAYVFGGAKDIGVHNKDNSDQEEEVATQPNNSLMIEVVATMKHIYKWLTLILLILIIGFGTWSMKKPVLSATNINEAWWSWGIVVFVSCIGFYGKVYLNFLEGLYKIALVRRIESLTSLGSIICSLLVLYFIPSLLNLVIVNQLWVILVTVRDWYLCRTIDNGYYLQVSQKRPFNKNVFRKVWQPAWRSGISGFMSAGLTNLTGLVYAQIGNSNDVASYLLAIRIITQVRDISMAPFYSKIPLLARLRVERKHEEFMHVVKRGISLSHIVFMLGFVTIGLFSTPLLHMLKSNIQFVSQGMWCLLGIAFFIHRYGAMHMQVYLSTNHIVSHIADGVSGIIYILASFILTKYIGIYAVPIGMIAGYLGFYAWYAAKYSYGLLKVDFWKFERQTSLLPIAILVVYAIVCFVLKWSF